MMKQILTTLALLFLFMMSTFGQKTKKTIMIESSDNLTITADLYQTSDKNAPYIILYHQARYSRGEYLEIAPKLNALGFNCIAIDQRSGDAVNGVKNETYQRAEKMGLATEYTDAWPDLVAALRYVKDELNAKEIIVWGSSYSSALVFVLASKYVDDINGIHSFSPGNYFDLYGKSVSRYA
jgi:dienelactone hydrolase